VLTRRATVDTGMPDGPRPGSEKPGSRILRDERLSPALRSVPQLFEDRMIGYIAIVQHAARN